MYSNHRNPRLVVAGVALALTLLPALALAYDWPQFDGDAQHSGNNTQETIISTTTVPTLQQRFQIALPDVADGAPVYQSGVNTSGGVKDLLFVTTKAGRIVALDAASGAQVWAHQPATGPHYTTSSPALDPSGQYVYSYGLEGKVHKYAVGDGTEVTTGGWPEVATLKPDVEKGSSALTTATIGGTSYLYIANGGYPGDAGDYQGHVTTINLADGSQHVFNAACSNLAIHFIENGTPGVNDCAHVQTAIWARPSVVYDPATSRIYMATGNGDFDGNSGGDDWGDTLFALNPDGTGSSGKPLDSYTPADYQQMQQADADLGSTSPAILQMSPSSAYQHVAAQSGKDSEIRLVNLDAMSGAGGPGHTGGELQNIAVPFGGEVLPTPATWRNPADNTTWLFVSGYNGISGLQLIYTGTLPGLRVRWTNSTGGSSPLVANGVLFYASSGHINALDPTAGTQLWSGSIGSIHWESPIVANGSLYITDESAHLTAYSPATPPPTSTLGPSASATSTSIPPTSTPPVPTSTPPPATSTPLGPTTTPTPAPSTNTPSPTSTSTPVRTAIPTSTPTPTPGGTLFYDDFEDGSTAAWAPTGGSWAICQPPGNSKEYCQSTSNNALSVAGNPSWNNYYVQGYVNFANANGGVSLLGRVQDSSHFYELELRKDPSTGVKSWFIWKDTAGSWARVGGGGFNYSVNTYYLLRLDMVGSALIASWSSDGGATFQTLGQGTDSSYPHGKIGVRSWGGPARFDVIKVVAHLTISHQRITRGGALLPLYK